MCFRNFGLMWIHQRSTELLQSFVSVELQIHNRFEFDEAGHSRSWRWQSFRHPIVYSSIGTRTGWLLNSCEVARVFIHRKEKTFSLCWEVFDLTLHDFKQVFWLCIYLLLAAYGVAILIGTSCDVIWCRIVMVSQHIHVSSSLMGYVLRWFLDRSRTWSNRMYSGFQVLGHAALANILWNHAKNVDLKSKSAITDFYMFVWKVRKCPLICSPFNEKLPVYLTFILSYLCGDPLINGRR